MSNPPPLEPPSGPPAGPPSAPPPIPPDPPASDRAWPGEPGRPRDWRAAALVIGVAALALVGFLVTSGDDGSDTAGGPAAVTSTIGATTSTTPATATTGVPGPGEIFLEPREDDGPDPFTPPVAVPPDATLPEGPLAPRTPSPIDTVPPPPEAGQVQAVSGATPGLYGGTRSRTTCDPAQLVDFLEANPAKAAAWAVAQQILPSEIRSYVATLTPVLLRYDTRVTNFGFDGSTAPSRQVVLQAGTAVLVDAYGTPRVRCYCGNPLSPPVPQDAPVYTGDPWPSFDPVVIVVISPPPQPVDRIVIVDVWTGEPFERPVGSTGATDAPSDDPFLQPIDTIPPVDTSPPDTTVPGTTPVTPTPTGDGTRFDGSLVQLESGGEVEAAPADATANEFTLVDGETIDVTARYTLPTSTDAIICFDVVVDTGPGDVVIDRTTGALTGSTTIKLDFTACGGEVADYPVAISGTLTSQEVQIRLTFTVNGTSGTLLYIGERVN